MSCRRSGLGSAGIIEGIVIMKIAVLICGLIFDSQKAMMKGIERKIRDLKDTCSVFCCHGSAAANYAFVNSEYNIFDLPDLTKFDGIIFVKNTFVNPEVENHLIEKIVASNVPTVCIDRYDEHFVNIASDEGGSIYALTEHMIKEHDCKKIYFVRGHAGGSDNAIREDGVRRAMTDHGLSPKEEWFYNGTYEYRSGIAAVDYFHSLDEKMADCIMCCNDQMAVAVCMQLKKLGYKVPRDVKVTGVDYDFVSRVVTPRLTTVKRQQYQKGTKSVEILHNFDKYKNGDLVKLPVALSIGETCGCHGKEENHNDVDDALAVDRYEQAELNQTVKLMTVDFLSVTDYSSLINLMCDYAYRMKPRELYLNLNVREEQEFDYTAYSARLHSVDDYVGYTPTVHNIISCVDGLPAPTGEVFETKDLYPPSCNGGREGVTYYFFPIHFQRRNFGYAIIGESGELVRNDFFPNWTNLCSDALENIRKTQLMEEMIGTLDKMWVYDTLTGIFNRAGFFKMAEPIIDDCINNEKNLCVVFLDVDGLKKINDTLGHDQGDELIKETAAVMKAVKKHGELIMRYGGDEFVLLAQGYGEAEADRCIEAIEKEMNNINSQNKHPFAIEASVGYYITKIRSREDINDIIEKADREMYKHKYVKKALRRN